MSEQFLADAGWGDAALAALPGDASTRTYARLTRPGQSAMLLRQPQKAESPAASAHASEAERRALGYNAVARLAGADCGRFAAVARYLRQRGLAAPQILAADFPQGLILIEDFGDDLFADVLADGGAEEKTLYQAAVEVLAQLHKEDAPAELPGGFALHAYDDVALLAEIELLTEWFLPLALGRSATDGEIAEHRRLWRAALSNIAGGRRVFVHRDYHAQNLFWMPERDGLGRVGLIDFQDAVAGSPAYDLVSLIEDARRDVAPELAEAATRHYLATMGDVDEARFRQEMAVMAAQRNAKIVGIFARLFKRDGKDRYLAYLPRVWSYLDRDLTHPSLADLRQWYGRTIPQEVRHLPQVQKEVA